MRNYDELASMIHQIIFDLVVNKPEDISDPAGFEALDPARIKARVIEYLREIDPAEVKERIIAYLGSIDPVEYKARMIARLKASNPVVLKREYIENYVNLSSWNDSDSYMIAQAILETRTPAEIKEELV